MARSLAFFGAFNPPTRAHIDLAEKAMHASGRNEVLFVPSKMEYIRYEQQKSYAFSDEERLSMLAKVAANRPWMRFTDIEMRQEQQPRTYHTLCMLRELGEDPSLLIGADKLEELDCKWQHIPEIASEFGIVCMDRGDLNSEEIIARSPFLKSLGIFVVKVPTDYLDISSSRVRECLYHLTVCRDELRTLLPAELMDIPKELIMK